MRVRKRYGIKEKRFRRVTEALTDTFGMSPEGTKFEVAETDGPEVYLVDGVPVALDTGDGLFPALAGILRFPPSRRYVTVDMGAVAFLANGANVMAPGIVEADPAIREGDAVWVREETHGRPLCVGRALRNGPDMVRGKGVAVETVHYVGDRLWRVFG